MSELHEHVAKCFSWVSIFIELSKGREITGYDILVHLENFGFKVSPGTIYTQLRILEKAGIIRSKPSKRGEAKKTLYQMTNKGVEAFNKFKQKCEKPLNYVYENLHS